MMESKESLDVIQLNIQRFIDSKFTDQKVLEVVLQQYGNLTEVQQGMIEPKMYVIYRGKYDYLFTGGQYNDSCVWMNKTIQHTRFERELSNNKVHFYIEAVKILLMLFLENGDETKLKRARKYFQFITDLNEYPETSALKDIYREDIEILKAVKDGQGLWTETKFTVPIAIKSISNVVHVELEKENIIAEVTCESGMVNNTPIQTNGVLIRNQDRESQVGNSTWNIKINRYLSCEKVSPIDKTASVMQEKVCKIVNLVIDRYRLKTNEYWVKKIYPSMVDGHSINYGADDVIFRKILMYDRGEYILSTDSTSVEIGDISEEKPIELYKKMFLGAQTYLLTEDLRECVLLLNIAFENFTYSVVCPQIVSLSEGKYEANFYFGLKPYQDFFLRDYLTEEQYKTAVQRKDIKPSGTSMYAIYKILWTESKTFSGNISKTEMNKLISTIRHNRNEFIHGSLSDRKRISVNNVRGQLDAFDKLMSLISS
ncbi:hypothetical protein RA086_00175 [Lactiplantibacillus sp. WILCCON 0030]|uniref:Apea-like HEPN domain-containing protein n=1 Tax=Lactiplantibacillus brownii TaxID=3069269 RepID=A0ABU1A512_9LACO|nr:hypothetical protein [Lactiplantibacillus brownii]MDQ7936064.1 hypothetical protein [Lactiplantibacillus brownii]